MPPSNTPHAEAMLPRLPTLTAVGAPGDGIVFAGNKQEVVPRRLFLDTRLTPLERNAWQVIRLMLNDDGVTVFPTYEQLRPFLASLPCSAHASDETIARALTALRLTRWLTLARCRRDTATGRIQGNLYVLHDEPLTPYEALALDPQYLKLVSGSLTHASKTIQYLAFRVLQDLTEDPFMLGRALPSSLERLFGQLARLGALGIEEAPEDGGREDVRDAHQRSQPPPHGQPLRQSGEPARPIHAPSSESEGRAPSSDSEEGSKLLNSGSLRIPKTVPTVRTVQYEDINNKTRTVPRACVRARLPERFAHLRAEQQAGALAALQPLEVALQQAVLEEWDARCRSLSVRSPAGYLFGLIQRALRGEFTVWAGRPAGRPGSAPPAAAADSGAVESDARRAAAQQHIAELKRLLAIRR